MATTYDIPIPLVRLTSVSTAAPEHIRATRGDCSILLRLQVAAKSGTELRKVGSVLESVDEVMANPLLLKGGQPALVESILKGTLGW